MQACATFGELQTKLSVRCKINLNDTTHNATITCGAKSPRIIKINEISWRNENRTRFTIRPSRVQLESAKTRSDNTNIYNTYNFGIMHGIKCCVNMKEMHLHSGHSYTLAALVAGLDYFWVFFVYVLRFSSSFYRSI